MPTFERQKCFQLTLLKISAKSYIKPNLSHISNAIPPVGIVLLIWPFKDGKITY